MNRPWEENWLPVTFPSSPIISWFLKVLHGCYWRTSCWWREQKVTGWIFPTSHTIGLFVFFWDVGRDPVTRFTTIFFQPNFIKEILSAVERKELAKRASGSHMMRTTRREDSRTHFPLAVSFCVSFCPPMKGRSLGFLLHSSASCQLSTESNSPVTAIFPSFIYWRLFSWVDSWSLPWTSLPTAN